MCHVSCVTCHVACVTCHIVCVMCHLRKRKKRKNPAYGRRQLSRRVRIVAPIPKQRETDRKGILFLKSHVSCVKCHNSHVTCHISHVMCHVSCVTCHLSLTPTATARYHPPASSTTTQNRLVCKHQKPPKKSTPKLSLKWSEKKTCFS